MYTNHIPGHAMPCLQYVLHPQRPTRRLGTQFPLALSPQMAPRAAAQMSLEPRTAGHRNMEPNSRGIHTGIAQPAGRLRGPLQLRGDMKPFLIGMTLPNHGWG